MFAKILLVVIFALTINAFVNEKPHDGPQQKQTQQQQPTQQQHQQPTRKQQNQQQQESRNNNQMGDKHWKVHHTMNRTTTHNNNNDHNNKCGQHASCIKCLSDVDETCFWCADTKHCDTYDWHRDLLGPDSCSYNEWHYSHCYIQEILFIVVITVLALLMAISICLFTYYCRKARRLDTVRHQNCRRHGNDGGHDIELLDNGTVSSTASSTSYGNCRQQRYGKFT